MFHHSHFWGFFFGTSTGTFFLSRMASWHSGIPTTPNMATKMATFQPGNPPDREFPGWWNGCPVGVSDQNRWRSVSRMGFLGPWMSDGVNSQIFSVSWEPLMSDEQCSKPWLGSSSGIIPNILGITIQERGIPFLVLNRDFMIFHGMTFQDLNTAQSAHLEIYSRKDKSNIRWTIPIDRIRWFPH